MNYSRGGGTLYHWYAFKPSIMGGFGGGKGGQPDHEIFACHTSTYLYLLSAHVPLGVNSLLAAVIIWVFHRSY